MAVPRLIFIILLGCSGLAQPVQRPVAVSPSFDFGVVMQGTPVEHVFQLKNQGSLPIQIKGAEASEPGIAVRFRPTIPPGGLVDVKVAWRTDSARGKVKGVIAIKTEGSDAPLVLELTGSVKPLVDILPHPAAFFSLYQGQSGERRLRVVNNDVRPLNIRSLSQEGSHFAARFEQIQPGKSYELIVGVPAGTEAGRFMEAVYLETDHPVLPRIRIPVNVLVKRDVHVSVESIDFGLISRRDIEKAPGTLDFTAVTFTVKKRQGKFEINSVETDLPFLRVEREPASGPSELFQFDARLVREKLTSGKYSGSLLLRTSDAQFRELKIPVTCEIR